VSVRLSLAPLHAVDNVYGKGKRKYRLDVCRVTNGVDIDI